MSVSQILTSEQGRYEWTVRDCLTTARAVVVAKVGAERADRYVGGISMYHAMPELDAWKLSMKHGGPAAHHSVGLEKIAETVDEPMPGDLVFFTSPVETRNLCRLDAGPGRELLGFVDDAYDMLHWTPSGLSIIVNQPPIGLIMRPG